MLGSQSVVMHSVTTWVPVLSALPAVDPDTLKCLNAHWTNTLMITANLTMPQVQTAYASSSPYTFHPHMGMFTSEFAVATSLQQLKKKHAT
jgi:hypothetical protein